MEQTMTVASNELLMAQLQLLDWSQLWFKLMARCFWILRNRYVVKWPNSKLKEFSKQTICEVINKIFIEKERKWNIERYPDFEDFIIGVIDSHINNELKKNSNDITIGDRAYLVDQKSKSEPGTHERISADELRKQVFDELEAAGADYNELLIFECLADGIEKPEDIKKELGLTDSDFHNTWRRFKRKRIIIQRKLAAYGY